MFGTPLDNLFDAASSGSSGIGCIMSMKSFGRGFGRRNLQKSFQRSVNDSPAPKSTISEFDVVPYRPSNSPLENHHGLLDKWASENIPGYVSRGKNTPTIALSKENHRATNKVIRDWMKEKTGKPVGGKINWKEVSPREMQELTERMFDAAKVPESSRRDYYRSLNQYMYGGSN